MPQPKWYGKSLSALCMDSIVDNMEKWTALRSSEDVSCHFFHLPSHCLEYMTECLLEDYWITEDMFDLLLSPHMKVLDLSELGTGRDAERNLHIVRLASDRCLQLTTLKIHDNPPLPVEFSEGQRNFEVEESFACILQRFEFLQILDLSFTIYGARSMLKLGSINQPKIRELLVDYCPGVTDTVVKVFCNGQSSLQILSVNGTEVTHSGIRFAIEHLPELKDLECDNESVILKAFRRIRKETAKKYSFNKWMWNPPDEVSYKKGSVSLMVDMCPSLVDVFIQVDEGFTDEELLGFRKLKQLKNFEIQTSPYLPSIISIRGGVIPLLQAHGLTLEQLYLTVEVTSEQVFVIIESCPNIHRLLLFLESTDLETPEPVVDNGVHSSLCSSKEVIPLRMLEEISLSSHFSRFAISRKLLLFLLFSPALTVVSIDECFTLDDKIIEEACARNSFKYLTKLKFCGCSNVSQKGIDFFLNEANPLSDIYLEDCGNVNPERMRTMAQEKHWNVKWNVED